MPSFLIIFFAKYLYLAVIALGLVFIFLQSRKEQKKIIVVAVPSLILAFLLGKLASHLYYDPRPFVVHHFTPLIAHAPTNGFPSDHALITFTIAAVLFVFNRKWGIVAGVLGLLVDVGRISAGIHSPIDVIGSFVISVVAVMVIHFILKRFPQITSFYK